MLHEPRAAEATNKNTTTTKVDDLAWGIKKIKHLRHNAIYKIERLEEECHISNLGGFHLRGCNDHGSSEDEEEANEYYNGGDEGRQNSNITSLGEYKHCQREYTKTLLYVSLCRSCIMCIVISYI